MPNHVRSFLRRHAVAPTAATGAGAPLPSSEAPVIPHLGAAIDIAGEREARRRELLSAARHRTRVATGKVHGAVGGILAGAADLLALNPFQILGLSLEMADIVGKDGALAALEARGREHYAARYARGVTLTMLGVADADPAPAGEPALLERLRDAGFAGAGHAWGGVASIPLALDLARTFKLTLLRYDSDHTPTFYVRKGVDQPAVADLMLEHDALVDQAGAQAQVGDVPSADPAASTEEPGDAIGTTASPSALSDAAPPGVDTGNGSTLVEAQKIGPEPSVGKLKPRPFPRNA